MVWGRLQSAVGALVVSLFAPALAAFGQSPIAHWKLDASSGTTAVDSSGNGRTGTVTGTATWVAGYINNGFRFNGATKIQAAGLMGNPANVTVAAWANLTSRDTSGAEVISLGDHFVLRLDSGTNTMVRFYNGSGTTVLTLPSTTFAGTGWHHFAAVFDDVNNFVKLYVDGVQAASLTTAASISYAGLGANTVIGRHGNGATTTDFNGIIDDVRVYNYALSAEEILDLVGRLAHWKLNETSGATAADASAYNRIGTVTGTAIWSAAVLNNGFSFNGATRIQATGLLNSPKHVSAAAWVNLTTADSGGSDVVTIGDYFVIRLDEAGAASVLIYNGSTWSSASVTQTFAGTGWRHVAATFDNTTKALKLYIDGAQAASTTTATAISYVGLGTNTLIGRHGNSGTTRDFTGAIDDVRIYSYALSASAVAELYGLVGHWKLSEASGMTAADSTIFAKTGAVTGGASWATQCNGSGVFDFNGSTHYISTTNASHLQPTGMLSIAAWIKGDAWGTLGNVDAIVRKGEADPNNYQLAVADGKVALYLDAADTSGVRGNTTLVVGQWYHVAATWDGALVRIYVNGSLDNTPTARTGTIGVDSRPLYIGGRSGADLFDGQIQDVRLYNRPLLAVELVRLAGLVGLWSFSEGSGATAADASGLGNNVTLSGATWTTDCAGYMALQTNGVGGIAQTSSQFTPPSEGTVAFWMKSSGNPATTARVFGIGADWEVRQSPDGTLSFDLSGDATPEVITTIPLNEVGRWYHVVETFNSADKSYAIYIDGQLDKSGINTNSMMQQPAGVLSFGTRTGTTEYWQGGLRDFRVYNRRLCPTEIAQLYGLVGYWKMDETSGTAAVDSSGMGRPGVVSGTAIWNAGKISNAHQFNGATGINVSGVFDRPRNCSLSAWANLTASDSGGAEVISLGDSIALRFDGGGSPLMLIYNGSSWPMFGFSQNYAGAGWHHFVAVFDDDHDAISLYADGVLKVSASSTASINYALGANTVIGRHGNGGSSHDFTGWIDDARVYNRPLCPTEIAQLYNLGGEGFQGVRIIKWVEVN